jgi:predicted nucleotidyltransferase
VITGYCSIVASAYAIRDNRAVWDGRSLSDWVPDLADVIVKAFDPRRIILFGSVAQGTDGPDSDIDLLVVLEQAPLADRRRLMVDLRRASRSIAAPHDLLVTSVEDFERNGNVPGTTEFEPATNGTVIYERRVS